MPFPQMKFGVVGHDTTEGSHFRSTQKKRVGLANRCHLCIHEDESANHIPINYGKARKQEFIVFSVRYFLGAP